MAGKDNPGVSILVLMELPYQRSYVVFRGELYKSFNPCFNGIAISTLLFPRLHLLLLRFNPCFNGIAISTITNFFLSFFLNVVSILVLMELPYQHGIEPETW